MPTPLETIQALDNAFNTGDCDTIVRLYDPSAVLLIEPGSETRGLANIAEVYRAVPAGTHVEQLQTHVVEADGIALFTSRYLLRPPGAPPQTLVFTVVLRQQPDGSWKNLIDNARGPAVLETPSLEASR